MGAYDTFSFDYVTIIEWKHLNDHGALMPQLCSIWTNVRLLLLVGVSARYMVPHSRRVSGVLQENASLQLV